VASIAEIIASVEPQQTVSSPFGSMVSPVKRLVFSDQRASRNAFGARDRVLIFSAAWPPGQRVSFRPERESRKSLCEINSVVPVAQPRHLTDHGLLKLRRLAEIFDRSLEPTPHNSSERVTVSARAGRVNPFIFHFCR